MAKQHYVIIGNSAAAIGCVEAIRKNDTASPITIISDEPHHTYSRPLISYLLYGKTDEQRMKYRGDGFYEDNDCEVLLGEKVETIDSKRKAVTLDDGKKISYTKLLVATGSSALVPSFNGLEKVPNKFTFMSLDDAKALEAVLDGKKKVLIVGAGLIGLKCAEGIMDRVGKVTVVDMADHILPSILDAEGAAIVQKHIEDKGVKFILSDSVTSFTANKARLQSGAEECFDILVVAVGVRPNVDLVKDAGGKVERGIIVNGNSLTSLPDVYAAGDCTESVDITTGVQKIMALLPNAYMQGEAAGYHMTGAEKTFDKAIPMNAIGFFGLHIITAGTYEGEVYETYDGANYKKLYTKDNLLKGYILIGEVERAGIYTALIREQTPLDTIDFELMKKHPQLMAFSKDERAQKLNGEITA